MQTSAEKYAEIVNLLNRAGTLSAEIDDRNLVEIVGQAALSAYKALCVIAQRENREIQLTQQRENFKVDMNYHQRKGL